MVRSFEREFFFFVVSLNVFRGTGEGGMEIIAESVKFDVVRHDTSIRPLENSFNVVRKTTGSEKRKKRERGEKRIDNNNVSRENDETFRETRFVLFSAMFIETTVLKIGFGKRVIYFERNLKLNGNLRRY